ncbi:MAG: GNAT family N-acetyltransferase [Sphingobacteriales bacterium]|jgi:ElaA protein|nr:GNAT family N-acetyltransferase [Sphingobacteriales bacterium]
MKLNWTCKHFKDLSPEDLYAVLQLRAEVFVVEQNCIFQDLDNKDKLCFHLMGWKDDVLIAYSRLVPQGVSYDKASIGRVIVKQNHRDSGLGRELMKRSISLCNDFFGVISLKIGAQLYLKDFYMSLDFEKNSDIYYEDGIEHIEMIRVYP